MSAVTAHDDHGHGHDHAPEIPPAVQLRSNRLGIWLFFVSEIFLFAALLVARFVLWNDPKLGIVRPELSQEIGLITTSVLLVSSYCIYRGEVAMANGDRKTFANNFLAAFVLGAIFFVGVVVLEWNVFGIEAPPILGIEVFGHLRPSDGVIAGIFFAMTGMHALHVLSGLILILNVWYLGRKGHFSAERHWGVEATALYWHYVDVVWIFFYPALYLIGTAVDHL